MLQGIYTGLELGNGLREMRTQFRLLDIKQGTQVKSPFATTMNDSDLQELVKVKWTLDYYKHKPIRYDLERILKDFIAPIPEKLLTADYAKHNATIGSE
jgi:hypothetical protein